jgi:hypothetical protein
MSEEAFTTKVEVQRWLLLRAIEWSNWPTFVSQPIVPVLFLVFPWYWVVLIVCIADLGWSAIRYRFVSVALARAAVLLVLLKWPSALICGIYLFFQRSYVAGVIALLWPILGTFIQVPGQIGRIELALAKKIGYVDEDASL